jgi:hypothetical protein
MKNRHLVVLLALLIFGILFWLLARRPQNIASQLAATNLPAAQPQSLPNGIASVTSQKQIEKTTSQQVIPKAVIEYVQKIKADPQYDWKQPINFYGRIIDQSNLPVTGASIHFIWNDISLTGTSEANTKSDANGFFSLTDRKGKAMTVAVGKDGYYGMNQSFEFANPAEGGFYVPDRNNPVVFHLRKKGPGADLIMSQNGMSTFITIRPATNGAPIFFDFFNQKVGENGQLKIEGWKEIKDRKTAQNNWEFRLTVPDGGLIQENDEFPFEAPEEGYQPVIEWHFTDGSPDWQGGINEKFYIKFGNPPHYGRITIQTGAFRPAVDLEYIFNPDGSTYLEPK